VESAGVAVGARLREGDVVEGRGGDDEARRDEGRGGGVVRGVTRRSPVVGIAVGSR